MENFQAIFDQAKAAANKAATDYLEKHGDTPYCGFAWVEFPSGRDKFVNWMRKNDIGSKHWKKGWQLWRPADVFTQSMDVNEAGAWAFAKVLNENGIQAHPCSRAD
jgi:hypothetical protein